MPANLKAILAIGLIAVLMAGNVRALAQENPPEKQTTLDIASAMRTVNDLYKDDIAAAKTVPAQIALAKKFLLVGTQTKNDLAGRYVLLSKASDMAAAAGDIDTALAAISELDKSFKIDSLKMQLDAATIISKTTQPLSAWIILSDRVGKIAGEAVTADRYDIAARAAALSQTTARQAGDKTSIQRAGALIEKVKACSAAFDKLKSSFAALQAAPTDPAANLAVGKFDCFLKGDWEHGLALLALAKDPALQPLVQADIAGPQSADEQLKLGDDWWELAQQNTGAAKLQIQQRACKWYGLALPSLTGLAQAKVQKRLSETSAIAGPRTVDLMPLIDVKKGMVHGRWKLQNGTLTSDSFPASRLKIPYDPPEEYDFHIEFVRNTGNDDVCQMFKTGGHACVWEIGGWGNTVAGFSDVDGKEENNPENQSTFRSDAILQNGHKYNAVIQVRKGSVVGLIDGKVISKCTLDPSKFSMRSFWSIGDEGLGLGTHTGIASFSVIEVIEISGPGKLLKQ